MKERIFNVYLFLEDRIIVELGGVVYERDGTDQEKTAYLQERSFLDYQTCKRFPLPESCILVLDGKGTRQRLSYEGFMQLQEVGRHDQVIEPVFADMGAPLNPLMVITPIVDGVPKVERVVDLATTV